MSDWSRYLESICTDYAQWWQVYTLTDVVGRQREKREETPLLFDFGLMVQAVEPDKKEQTERLDVLEGRPGSGKSTALVRLLLEEAGKARTPLNPPLPRGEEKPLAPPLPRGAGGGKNPCAGRTPLPPHLHPRLNPRLSATA